MSIYLCIINSSMSYLIYLKICASYFLYFNSTISHMKKTYVNDVITLIFVVMNQFECVKNVD